MNHFLATVSRGFTSKLILLVTDIIGILLSFSLAYRVRFSEWPNLFNGSLAVIIVITVATLYVLDVYRTENPSTRARLPLQTFLAVPIAGLFTSFVVYAMGTNISVFFGRGILISGFALFSLWASMARWLITKIQVAHIPKKHWIVLADTDTYHQFEMALEKAGMGNRFSQLDPSQHLSQLDATIKRVKESLGDSWGIIVANSSSIDDDLARRIMNWRFAGIKVLSLGEFYEQYWSRVPVLHLKSGWFVESAGFQWVNDQVGLRVQRAFDLLTAVIGLILLSPLFLFIGLAVRLTSKGPALYQQTRVGLHGKPFTLYKFRTMHVDAEREGAVWAIENDPRTTSIGLFLRRSRLDELPQIYNILTGKMSLIGPRPERPEFVEELERQIPFYDVRHLVVPGVTGWAQVMYPYGASTEDARHKLEYDLYYIKNHSIQLDFAILIKTILVILRHSGQ